MSVAIVEYGVGNLFSLTCSFEKIGETVIVTADADTLLSAERVILPGVGAFGDAIDSLRARKLDAVLKERARRGGLLMGVCLGMQLLFDESEEYGVRAGLKLLPGRVTSLRDALPGGAKVPHMGWNGLTFDKPDEPLLRGLREGAHVYFVHSFRAVDCADAVSASADYLGARVPAVVRRGNVLGAQFHPEKSGDVGLTMLKNFCGGAT